MKENNFSLLKLFIIFLIATTNAFALACLCCVIVFAINESSRSDIAYALPLLNVNTSSTNDTLSNFFMFIMSNYTSALFISGIIIVILLFIYLFFMSKQDLSYRKPLVLTFVLLMIPIIYFIVKECEYFEYVFLLYLYGLKMHTLLEIVFFTFAFPTWGILCLSYTIYSDFNKIYKLVLIIIISVLLFYFNYDFYNTLKQSALKCDYKRELSSIYGLNLDKKDTNKSYSILFSNGKISNITIKPELYSVPVSRQNWNTLKKYLKKNPDTLLRDNIYNYALNYYLLYKDIEAYRKYIADCYIEKPDNNNSYFLTTAIMNASEVNDIPEKLEQVYKNTECKISKVAYGFLALNFQKEGNTKKEDFYWNKYDKTASKEFSEEQLKIIYDQARRKDKISRTFAGSLYKKNRPGKGINLMLINQTIAESMLDNKNEHFNDRIVSKIYSYTTTDDQGKFKLTSLNLHSSAILIEGNYSSVGLKKLPEDLSYSNPDETFDLGEINLIP